MDFNLKQWKDQQQPQQQESAAAEEEQVEPCSKIPRQLLFLDTTLQQHQQQQGQTVSTALPLFHQSDQPITNTNKLTSSHLSFYSPHTFSKVEGGHFFSTTQWEELQVQALIYRHMMVGAAVPPELLHLVNNTFLSSSPSYSLPHYPPHFQPAALLQAGYWGKGAMDPEPGRCRRTDGKKWRCSRDVMAGHKYCERHVHRGRSRSRKPVEFPPPPSTGGAGGGSTSISGGATQFTLTGTGHSSFDVFQLNQRPDKKTLFESQHDAHAEDVKSSNNNKMLMHFFDDWPRSLEEETNNNPDINRQSGSGSCLSMSSNANPTSNFLRLSTGNVDELGRRNQDRGQGWGANPVGSMGGPLAEALRSSTNLSPTSVLHQLPRCSTSDTSNVTA